MNHINVMANVAGNGGGIANFKQGELTLRQGQVSGNEATEQSGGGVFNDAGVVNIYGTAIADNIAAQIGGGVSGNHAESQITLDDVQLTGNSVRQYHGGGLYVQGEATLTACRVANNTASGHGGGINNHSICRLYNTDILANTATNGGGVANFQGASLTVENGSVASNEATGQAGGGVLLDVAQATISGTTFSENMAAQFGGAISLNSSQSSAVLDGVVIENNQAPTETAFTNFGTMTVRNSTISGSCKNHQNLIDDGGNSPLCSN